MDTLKNVLLLPPVLGLPYSSAHMATNTDVGNVQIGSFLLQMQPDDTTKPIGYWSRSLTNTERQNDTTQRECLTIFWSISYLRSYLEGQCFTVQTDHDALERILYIANSTDILARWRLRFLKFNFDAIRRSGKKLGAPGTFSWPSTTGEVESPLKKSSCSWP